MADFLSSLNPVQRQAVVHDSGPLLILAGAGSGKTRTLTHRVAHLIAERGVAPWRILAVTFTNKAAGELKQRVQRLLGNSEPPWVSTFHSACVRILRRDVQALGYTRDFVIYDDQDQERLLKDCLRELDIGDQVLTPRAAAGLIDAAKNRGVSPEQYDRNDLWHERAAKVYALYQQKMRRANAVDFGDLLLLTVRLFEEHPAVLDRYRDRLWHVLVDEYQDTNRVQYRLTNLLTSERRNLCVVGDEDQSIYRWRGAEISNILDFERDYPDATVIRLEQNYRSTGIILDAAGAVVAQNTQRKGKKLWTENPRGDKVTVALLDDDLEESRWVAGETLRLQRQGRSLRDVAIFYRANAQSRPFEETLTRNGIPYAMVGGIRFFARAEVKDVLAYLRLVVNPADSVAAKRIVNVPVRGIGNTTIERLVAFEPEAGTFIGACRLALKRGALKSAAVEKVEAFLHLTDSFRAMLGTVPFPELTARIVEQTGYGPMLRDDPTDEAQERLQNVEELLKGMEEYVAGDLTLNDYLEQVALKSDIDSYDQAAERVTLMTMHSAKGLEYPVVFMTAMEEGLFPHARKADEDIEEERRLCYVGMTRAMEKLYLTHARRRRVFGDFQFNDRSRFVDEVPAELLHEIGNQAQKWEQARQQTEAFARQPQRLPSPIDVHVEYDDALRVGARVRHATFGLGTVQRVEGSGDGQKATVFFNTVGRKKLVLKFAGLEPA
jgi:DNA helicase-2/ATP-dependent DNA helicase PcrA